MIIGGVEFPDSCPLECPGHSQMKGHGGLCYRCPIFVCREFDCPPDRNGNVIPMRLVEPEDYRPDWAREWRRWFDGGMKGYPELSLKIMEGKNGDG